MCERRTTSAFSVRGETFLQKKRQKKREREREKQFARDVITVPERERAAIVRRIRYFFARVY